MMCSRLLHRKPVLRRMNFGNDSQSGLRVDRTGSHESGSALAECGSAPAVPAQALPNRILIAEDDEVIRQLTSNALTRAGFVVQTTADGEEAWDELNRRRYDLLITDNEMPRLRGIQLIERIRRIGMRLPVIVCSASFAWEASPSDDLKITAVLVKPLGFHEFLQTVQRVLKGTAVGIAAGHPGDSVP